MATNRSNTGRDGSPYTVTNTGAFRPRPTFHSPRIDGYLKDSSPVLKQVLTRQAHTQGGLPACGNPPGPGAFTKLF